MNIAEYVALVTFGLIRQVSTSTPKRLEPATFAATPDSPAGGRSTSRLTLRQRKQYA